MNSDLRELVEAVLGMSRSTATGQAGSTELILGRVAEIRAGEGSAGGNLAEAGQIIAAAVGGSGRPWNEAPLKTGVSAGGSSSMGAGLSGVATRVIGGGILALFKGLFGGGDDRATEAAETPVFRLPRSIRADLGYSAGAGRLAEVAPSNTGLRRQVGEGSAGVQQITVNVQALDSQSFLDHSSEIARAVKEALLHSDSLSSVISEL